MRVSLLVQVAVVALAALGHEVCMAQFNFNDSTGSSSVSASVSVPTEPTTNVTTTPTSTEPTTEPTTPTTTNVTEPVTTQPTTEPTTTQPTDAPTTPTTTNVTEPVTTQPTTEPVTTQPTTEPVTEPVTTQPTTEPVTEPVTTQPTSEPVTPTPNVTTVDPVTTPVVTVTSEPPVTPTSEPVVTPTSEPVVTPTSEPVVTPTSEPVVTPTSEPVVTPTSEPVVTPTSEPVVTPTSEPVVTPTSEPVVTPTSDPVTPNVTSSEPPPVTPNVTGTTPVPTTTEAPYYANVTPAIESVDPPTHGSTTEEPTDNANDETVMPDIVLYNSSNNKLTDTPPDAQSVGNATERPVVLDMRSGSSATETPKPYVRGDDISETSTTGSTAGTNAPNIIGGRRRNAAVDSGSILSKSSATFHDFLRYASTAFAGISVALLLFFHYVSLDPSLTWSNLVWSPNTWEFLVYGTFLQQMASVSQMMLLKTPYYLFDYADGFAWTNFLIQHGSSSSSAARRRLEDIVLGGVVAYADRIGLKETNILARSVVGFVVIFGIMLVLFVVIALIARRKAESEMGTTAELPTFTQSVHGLRSASIRTLGLCVLIWFFALYPLSLYSSFEISMEFKAKSIATALSLALAALGIVCFGVLAWAGRVILHKSKDELLQFEIMATWGSLYAEMTFRSRMFFVAGVLVQIVTGIVIGAIDSVPAQIIVVIAIELVYLLAVFMMRPFADTLIKYFTYGLSAIKIVNYSLCFSFTYSSTMSSSALNSMADAYIYINTIVIIAWFIRLLIVFSHYIRSWSDRSSFAENLRDNESVGKHTDNESDIYANLSTSRYVDATGASSNGEETLRLPDSHGSR